MGRITKKYTFSVLMLLGLAICARAENVKLKIQALNPASQAQTCEVKSYLPAEIKEEDILDRGILNVNYDVASGAYFVHGQIELQPRERRILEVTLRDVWLIPQEKIQLLDQRAVALSAVLAYSRHREDALSLERQIHESLTRVREEQGKNLMSKVTARKHMDAYAQNLELMLEAERKVLELQQLVSNAGRDPGKPVTGKPVPDAAPPAVPIGRGDTITLHIEVKNPATADQAISFRHELPEEIQASDVLDGDGLDARVDFRTGRSFLGGENIELASRQTIKFNVVLRDKWNAGNKRLASLKTEAGDLLTQTRENRAYRSSEQAVLDLIDKLGAMKPAIPADVPTERYVEFCRARAEEMDAVAEELEAIRSLKPPPGPTVTTTWLAIVGIVGFLALVVVIVLVITSRKSKATTYLQN